MLKISYFSVFLIISAVWILIRLIVAVQNKNIHFKRELQLILVYVCIIVVTRFTFFPFSRIEGEIQPLVFDIAEIFPCRINLIPFINLLDYPEIKDLLLNLIGNTTMFIPLGIVWPVVYKKLNTHKKVLFAGVGFSLCIEILQLPFYDRVTDIDDLILNSLGFTIGYLIYLLARSKRNIQA